jgi:hypothetical protein
LEEQTPEGQTLDVAAGRNKPAKPVAEQAVEGVRNAEDGTKRGLETPRTWTPLDAAMREETPWEVLRGGPGNRARAGRVRNASTLQRPRSSRENEPIAQVIGDGSRKRPREG